MRIRPSIYLCADTHFGHSKLWSTWEHRKEGFEEELIEAWNSVVTKNDVILHLGDLSICNKEKTNAWTKQLKGKKYLILGNHDSGSDSWFRDCGFEVIPSAYQKFGQKDDSYIHILFTHEPVRESLPDGWFNIHGHLHGGGHRASLKSPVHIDVGVDAIGFKPVPLYKILSDYIKPKS